LIIGTGLKVPKHEIKWMSIVFSPSSFFDPKPSKYLAIKGYFIHLYYYFCQQKSQYLYCYPLIYIFLLHYSGVSSGSGSSDTASNEDKSEVVPSSPSTSTSGKRRTEARTAGSRPRHLKPKKDIFKNVPGMYCKCFAYFLDKFAFIVNVAPFSK
jgi:hypothetical protein